jgi:hypothetical protein
LDALLVCRLHKVRKPVLTQDRPHFTKEPFVETPGGFLVELDEWALRFERTRTTHPLRTGHSILSSISVSHQSYIKRGNVDMTAEIAIMNKYAVALAADSAVTIPTPGHTKVFNSASKVFRLSKYAPVGLMVYGNGDFMGLPWESVIKDFRARLGEARFPKLEDYSNRFLQFLASNDLTSNELQRDHFELVLSVVFIGIARTITKRLAETIQTKGQVLEQEVRETIADVISKEYEEWRSKENCDCLPSDYGKSVLEEYDEVYQRVRKAVFRDYPLSRVSTGRLRDLAQMLFAKKRGIADSGVVIAGFGDSEPFPSLVAYQVQGALLGQLKHNCMCHGTVTQKQGGMVIPFAQTASVDSFIGGIDPLYKANIDGYLLELLEEYPKIISEHLPDAAKEELVAKLKEAAVQLYKLFSERAEAYRKKHHVEPIIESVGFLPKEELAVMAESLVNLTSFRQRISLRDAETVGGPIDVAVISKGDGFIWIKRKHYFRADLNPHFFANYYRLGPLVPGVPKEEEHDEDEG